MCRLVQSTWKNEKFKDNEMNLSGDRVQSSDIQESGCKIRQLEMSSHVTEYEDSSTVFEYYDMETSSGYQELYSGYEIK